MTSNVLLDLGVSKINVNANRPVVYNALPDLGVSKENANANQPVVYNALLDHGLYQANVNVNQLVAQEESALLLKYGINHIVNAIALTMLK